MNKVLNSIIKFDLHIHSKASEYKEVKGIVDQSTKENLGILLSSLHENNVALFSITDHNRFDPDIYNEVIKILAQPDHPYQNVKAILAGVEFDVILDKEMDKCHIIAIFDTNNSSDRFQTIKAALGSNLLTDVKKAYTKNEFEDILRKIDLNTILIASQTKNIYNQSGKHNSLSDSAMDVEQIIRVGYINALEFQKPKVEGILMNNLKELSLPIPLFSGSDCHDWAHYPYHSLQNQNREFHHSRAKVLPTFKGLLMAITSPETRFNRSGKKSSGIIKYLQVKDRKLPLVDGINAIIGENGSGKTTLLKLINGKTSESHVKQLIENNILKSDDSNENQRVKYIEQGEIIKKFHDNILFSVNQESNFKELDSSLFKKEYTKYSISLKSGIKTQIDLNRIFCSLPTHEIAFEKDMLSTSYYVDIADNENFNEINNIHYNGYKDIQKTMIMIDSLLANNYFDPYRVQLKKIADGIKAVKEEIETNWKVSEFEIRIKNIIYGCVNDYLRKVKENTSTKDREVREYKRKKECVINAIVNTIKKSGEKVGWPTKPPILDGVSKNPRRGFYFNREAAYNKKCMLDNFYAKMFINEYNTFEKLSDIDTLEKFSNAIRNCTSASDIEKKWEENSQRFINESVKTNDYIMDGVGNQVGNTLGEMSLSYYKFFTQDKHNWDVLIIDQPEDNISNNNISKKLIHYFNDIRDEKQIIFVTHNPLLVVNLDADNVIFVQNNNWSLSFNNGCLEYENEHTNILELVAQNMDGGKETIEKRLKVYGNDNKTSYV